MRENNDVSNLQKRITVLLLVCRIDSYGLVKVTDYFRLTEDIVYGSSYNKEKGEGGSEEKAPIRWMAPESIENDIYTESTDVVS